MIHSLSKPLINWKGWIVRNVIFSIEAKIIFNAMPTEPNYQRKILIDNLVRGLMEDNIWSNKLDCLYIKAAHANNSSLLNWINPGTFDLTVVNLAAGQFTIDRGWTGNGVNGYLNTNYNPSTDAINYALDDASIGIYIRTDINEVTFDLGISNINDIIISIRNTNLFFTRLNSIGFDNAANLDSRGSYISIRNDNINCLGFKNKIKIFDLPENSTAIPDGEIYISCFNNNGIPAGFSTKQVAESHIGSGMTQTDVNNKTDRIETYMDAIGAGIIP